jgi:hypothetical protein
MCLHERLGIGDENAQTGYMKKKASPKRKALAGKIRQKAGPNRKNRVHPVVIYPYRQPSDYSDLENLYGLVAELDSHPDVYARPLTVVDHKTIASMEHDRSFAEFRRGVVGRCSEVIDAWCVDTCQMWYSGLGQAFQQGKPGDVYWLIPGDFNYGTSMGRSVLDQLHDLPEICMELQQDVCIGEIATDHNNPKQLIDTYGTFALLYNWFPEEGREIRQFTERPRSEFFALHHDFLQQLLRQRWYAYEQTVVTLLQAVFGNRRISRFFVGHVSDLPGGRESLGSAIQQVERTERVLKSVWRERNESRDDWVEQYRVLEAQSEQILRTAIIILQNLLG